MKEISILIPSIYNKFEKLQKSEKISAFIPEITVSEEYYLDILYSLKNPTFTEFAQKSQITKPAASQIIKNLIEKKYVEKVQCKKDRRVYYIKINDEVKKHLEECEVYLKEKYEKCLSFLSKDEKRYLVNILFKIDKSLDQINKEE